MVLQKTTSISLMLVAVSVIAISSIGTSYADERGMEITATAQEGSDTITVTGNTSSTVNDVSILVEAPNRNIVTIAQVTPDEDGNFETTLKIGNQLWNQDGFYTITAQQGDATLYKLSVRVQVVGGAAFETMVTQSTFDNTIVGGGGTPIEMTGLVLRDDSVLDTTTVIVVGHTDRTIFPITLTVQSPNGNVITIDQVSPDTDGNFDAEFQIGGDMWSQDGLYTVTAQQGDSSNYKSVVEIDVLDGKVVPEFGTIAALILAVAIISIIAVSARSRLSIMPKY